MKYISILLLCLSASAYCNNITPRTCRIKMLEINKNFINIQEVTTILEKRGYKLDTDKLMLKDSSENAPLVYYEHSDQDGLIILISSPSVYNPLIKFGNSKDFYEMAFHHIIKKWLDTGDYLKKLNQKFYALIVSKNQNDEKMIYYEKSYKKIPVLRNKDEITEEMYSLLSGLPNCR